MKELLGDDIEEDDEDEEDKDEDEDEDEDEEGESKSTKAAIRKPGFDIDQGQTIFVRNVPFDATADDLKEVFRRFGRVGFVKKKQTSTPKLSIRATAIAKSKALTARFVGFVGFQSSMVAAWAAEEEVLEGARRPRSVSDFCVRYELIPRKPSDGDKVSPHAYSPHLQEMREICQQLVNGCFDMLSAAPMLYYCVGFVNADSLQQSGDFTGGWQQESPDSSYWTPEPSQPSRSTRSKSRHETPPKVLQAGQVHRDASKGSEAALVKEEERTTIMLRNIPKDSGIQPAGAMKMMDLLNTLGYAKMYDFLYLPRDFKDNFAIYGYAFVNFVDNSHASKALELFNGFMDWQSGEENIVPCEAHWGHPLQGYDAHVERYRNSPVMSSQVPDMCRPVVLQDGLPVSFPTPTKPIRLPRRKGWILTGKRAEQARSA
eukprot:g7335.t2